MGVLQSHEERIKKFEGELRETRNTLERALHQLSILEGNAMGAVDTAADLGSDPVLSENDRPVCLLSDVFWGTDAAGTVKKGPIKLTWNAETSRWEGGVAGGTVYLETTPVKVNPAGIDLGHLDEVLLFNAGILSLRDNVNVANAVDYGEMKFGYMEVTIGGVKKKWAMPVAILTD